MRYLSTKTLKDRKDSKTKTQQKPQQITAGMNHTTTTTQSYDDE